MSFDTIVPTSKFSLDFEMSETGLWFVTTKAAPNVFIAHRDLEKIIGDLPLILRHTFQPKS